MLATVHYASLFVYLCIIVQSVVDLSVLRTCKRAKGGLRIALYSFLACVIIQSLSLMYLQVNWLYANAGVSLSHSISMTWLVFDLVTGLVLFLYVMSIRIFLEWKTKDDFDFPAINGVDHDSIPHVR